MMRVVSSAKSIENINLDAFEKSFINTVKKRGPRIEPWSTPCVISFVSALLLLYTTNRDLFLK